MLWIGLSGGIGTGKSTVTRYLRSLGYPVADADSLAHAALEPGQESWKKIVQVFGSEIVDPTSQKIDRKKLGQIVFQDKLKVLELEKIIHPFVQVAVSKLRAEWEAQGHRLAFYDVPLLFEKNLEKQFDKILFIYADPVVQVERIQKRNCWSEEETRVRLSHQLPLEIKRQRSDFIVDNSGDEESTQRQVDEILKKLS